MGVQREEIGGGRKGDKRFKERGWGGSSTLAEGARWAQ